MGSLRGVELCQIELMVATCAIIISENRIIGRPELPTEASKMNNTKELSNQTRRFTLHYFFEQYKEAWLMILGECRAAWCKWRAKRRKSKTTPPSNYVASLDPPKKVGGAALNLERRQEELDNGERSTLTYGLCCLSKMLHLMLLYGPGFVFDPRPGLLPSRRFIWSYYVTILAGLMLGVIVAKMILEPTMINVLPGLAKSIVQLLALTTTTSEILLIIYGLGSILVVVHNRHFLREFVLNHCNFITLPRSYQRRKAVELFLSHYILALLSKPLFISLTVICDPEQPKQLIHWSPRAFALARAFSIALTSIGSLLVCTSGMVVPYISSFLIICSASYLKNFLDKHLARMDWIRDKQWERSPRQQRQNPRILGLLDDRTRQLISDYSCDTLTEDWPNPTIDADDADDADDPDEDERDQNYRDKSWCIELTPPMARQEASEIPMRPAANIQMHFKKYFGACFGANQELAASPPIVPQHGEKLPADLDSREIWMSGWEREATDWRSSLLPDLSRLKAEAAHYNSASNSLLFLYKNLIKSTSELKGLIAVYEKKFGTFHLIQICIDSLIVAQWITTSLTESRLRNESRLQRAAAAINNPRGANTSNLDALANEASAITPLAIEASIGVLSFIISNTYIFMRCDCLPDCMVKIRSKLFKMNIDLARSALRAHARPAARAPSGQSSGELGRRFTSVSTLRAPSGQLSGHKFMRSASVGPLALGECAELDQVWSLYDQLVRMSEQANFKLTAGTYYSKRCLLWIFGRTVSLTLLCIQIVDIYSYT